MPPRTPRKRRFPSNNESCDNNTSDSEDERQHEVRESPKRKNAKPKLESQPPFMQTSEIFGGEAPIPLCRGPVVQPSEIRRNDMNVMAESIADALGKEGDKIGKLSARRMNSFSVESLRGFGGISRRFLFGCRRRTVGGYASSDCHFSTS